MRYLGVVAQGTTLPHIRDICYTEMFARTLKRLFNTNISNLILKRQERKIANKEEVQQHRKNINLLDNPDYQGQITIGTIHAAKGGDSKISYKDNMSRQGEELKELLMQAEMEQKELENSIDTQIEICLIDFLNVIFGGGEDSKNFWEEILIPETAVYYTEAAHGDLQK